MSTQSRYTYSLASEGLGRFAMAMTNPMVRENRMILQPFVNRSGSGSGTNTVNNPPPPVIPTPKLPPPVIQPVKPPEPVIPKAPDNTNGQVNDNTSGSSAPFLAVDGDEVVIQGRHRVNKRTAMIAGGGLAGSLLLFSLIR